MHRLSAEMIPLQSLDDGRPVMGYTLSNDKGLSVKDRDLGATIMSIRMPDRNGEIDDVVLGYAKPQDYLDQHVYMGSVIGRYAGRISDGRFALDGNDYVLARNNGPNTLHGGKIGFDQKIWSGTISKDKDSVSVSLTLNSPHMEEGFPGNLDAKVTYRLDKHNRLFVEYEARSDRPTHVNLSQHSYFNLEGRLAPTILDHRLMIKAEAYTPLGENAIPTGEIVTVSDTPLDFREGKQIGLDIENPHPQMRKGSGYDHNFVLDGVAAGQDLPPFVAQLDAPLSGRSMKLYSDHPGLQLYTGNFLRPELINRDGVPYRRHAGVCLETQHFPDSPNQPAFPTTRLEPTDIYRHQSVFEFSSKGR